MACSFFAVYRSGENRPILSPAQQRERRPRMANLGVVVAVVRKAEGRAQGIPVNVAARVSGCRVRLPPRGTGRSRCTMPPTADELAGIFPTALSQERKR